MTALTIDPVLAHAAAAAIAALLATAAIGKLRDLAVFEHAVAGYELLPARVLPIVARALPIAELAIAAAMLPTATRAGASLAAVVLLVLVTTAAAAALVIARRAGRDPADCGCGGIGSGLMLSWPLVARNAVLVAVAGLAALPVSVRETGFVDAAAAVLATFFAVTLYAAANQLIANQPRLRQLRNAP